MSDVEPKKDPADSTPVQGADSQRQTSLSLLEGIRGNDPGAWRRLVYLYTPLISWWCGQAGVRPPDSDDVAQEVFRAAVSRLGDFSRESPGDSFRGWLRAITRNVLLAHRRRLASQADRPAGGSNAWQDLQQIANPDDMIDEEDPPSEVRSLYLRALELVHGEFEARTWQAFWLVTVEGHTPTEVAAKTGVSAAAVRKAKSRILRRLKEEVGDLAH